jgi:hypothetical protein
MIRSLQQETMHSETRYFNDFVAEYTRLHSPSQ